MNIIRASMLSLLFVMLLVVVGCSSDERESTDRYPEKSIELVVAFSPGAATDTQARIVGKYAQEYLGEELVIVNRPGGGGQVGWNHFSNVNPDGYVLSAYNLPHIITQPLVGQTSFEIDTFEPIVNWGWDPTVFAVRSDSSITDLEGFVEKAKASPGEITIGNAGQFVGQHLAILLFEDAAGVELEDIPFQGAADAIASLLGGHTDVVSGNLSDMYRLGEDVRILAVATEERHEFIPDVPTFAELGFSEVVMSTDRGIAARQGTPESIIQYLEDGFMELLQDEGFLAEMEQAGVDLLIMDREETIAEFETRTEQYQELLNSIDIE
ncbi:tripartite tricarboxylate transporter substrate binding protein [Desertibacillus haloalkaliphilus]|uniref:tripartite tricarboxylate transporter substrate binding protein n=1 Tax=Desertibacillus haloalkaliphilus TaxID=1328930 RepID=UPI001C273F60|nr:tripartite tricarboxylate transporter substrate binding protein [Desertibacillus haloalkaliphilus]MBU8906938.1 tripartite tricarboxylate transporter substrate binding protein [Desertibacillus haloalkaliphilus]